MYVLERILGIKQQVGAAAFRGTAVEAGVALGLEHPDAPLDVCAAAALAKYDDLAMASLDARRDDCRKPIPAMVESALAELRPYGIPDRSQGFITWHPDDLEFPIVGYFDFAWDRHGIIVDLKTSERMPTEIKAGHARQVSLYCSSDNYAGRLAYVTPKKRATYELENVRAHRNALHQIARRVEAFLKLSDDPQFFVSITAPDIDSFYWMSPQARAQAFSTWSI
jgi:hypothetical protein